MKPTIEIADPVFKKYGLPFLTNGKGKVVLNERAVAIKCATAHMVKFNTSTKSFERYDSKRGLWAVVNEVAVARALDNLLFELAATYGHQDFVARITAAKLSSLCKMMRPHDAYVESENAAGMVHVRNGVVALGGGRPKLMPHNAKYPFHASSGIAFDPKASCPKFLKQFLGTALAQADTRSLCFASSFSSAATTRFTS